MNKPELESILKKARLPEIAEESLEMFPRRIVARLKRNDPRPRAREISCRAWRGLSDWPPASSSPLPSAIGAGGWKPTIAENDSLASAKLIRETLALFPNRVRAIVQDEHGLNLVLSDNADVPVRAALRPHLRRPALLLAGDLQRPGNPGCRTENHRAGRRARRNHFDRQTICLVEQRIGLCGAKIENRGKKSRHGRNVNI
jgi:hypothetical protein